MLSDLFAQNDRLLPQFLKGRAVVAALLYLLPVALSLLWRGSCRRGHLRNHPHAVNSARPDVDAVHGQPQRPSTLPPQSALGGLQPLLLFVREDIGPDHVRPVTVRRSEGRAELDG
ncbi:hypothetical protein SBI_07027 [Streptomyces bingchenggensis BCW-1]|uniref:Uncharacterized protein n=1 Tax=Streptomyces bingchenggensis (strain BCW-1) TaxID=749414 RepID=D7C3C2_STRBB|nr:hypothetical protein SBI_07027 [Streptomyces bingchenggensis BCW-1]